MWIKTEPTNVRFVPIADTQIIRNILPYNVPLLLNLAEFLHPNRL